jgi:type I restriction enzyme R subunit
VTYAQSIIDDFSIRGKLPHIAVSVDMLDTGIDVPDILNLVFFKKIYSKIKFIQMIGRGTRLSENIFGISINKEQFYIFDFCDNFNYFEMNPNGRTIDQGYSMTQKIFQMKLDLLFELQKQKHQTNDFNKTFYERIRVELHELVSNFNRERILVRDKLPLVVKYSFENEWFDISEFKVQEIKNNLTLLVDSDKDLESAKAFDLKVFYIMLSQVSADVIAKKATEQVVRICRALLEKLNIPQIADKRNLLAEVTTQTYWDKANISILEKLRAEIRELIQYLAADGNEVYTTDFEDELIVNGEKSNRIANFRTYHEKVLDYLLSENKNETVSKIKNLDKLSSQDIKEIERILWEELGTKEDYFKVTDEQNLALFIRSIVGIEQEAINQKFSKYLQDNSLSSKQQEFVKEIIDYVRLNGDISREDLPNISPFSDYDIGKLFDRKVDIIFNVIKVFNESINTSPI